MSKISRDLKKKDVRAVLAEDNGVRKRRKYQQNIELLINDTKVKLVLDQ